MMNSVCTHIRDAVDYALADRKAVLLIGVMVFTASLISKDDFLHPVWNVFRLTIFFIVGYGSYISWYTLKGSDRHPDIRNWKRLMWEGFKKSTIIAVYSAGMGIARTHAVQGITDGNIALAVLCAVLFAVIYILLIGGLFNRYLNRGKFLKAFDFPEIIRLLRIFDLKSFIRVVGAVIVSQAFAVLVVIGFGKGFSLFEILFSIAAVFLAPFLYFSTKRLVGLNVRELLDKMDG